MKTFSSTAAYNEGGLGKCLAQVVEEARSQGKLGRYYSSASKPNDAKGEDVSLKQYRWLFRVPPLRYSMSWRDFLAADLFDRAVAARLQRADAFHGQSGRCGRSFARARQLGCSELVLDSPTCHIAHVVRQHRRAMSMSGMRETWVNDAQTRKITREYAMADCIYVASEYSRQTFVEAGIQESRLRRRVLRVEPRFAPPIRSLNSTGFTIAYVGRLQVSKGLHVLLDAFREVKNADAELILVGGTATDTFSEYLQRRMNMDARIKLQPGDPLPILHRADVLVHPSFEDGLALAPLEALACGVPVIVTEDTGMKEYVVNGHNGYVVPTGNTGAIIEQLRAIELRPLKGTFAPLSLA